MTPSARFDIHHLQVKIGRARARDHEGTTYLHIRRNTIGRSHATLRLAENGFVIDDHHSINGTFVNGTRVVATTPVTNGDLITFDEFRFRLHVPFGVVQPAEGAVPQPDKTIVLPNAPQQRYGCASH